MTPKFNTGDLVCYKRQDLNEDTLAVILYVMFHNIKGFTVFRCLIDGRTENICEAWLKHQ